MSSAGKAGQFQKVAHLRDGDGCCSSGAGVGGIREQQGNANLRGNDSGAEGLKDDK